jgi:hypothetical protein
MEFDNAAQEGAYVEVRTWLGELYGESLEIMDDVPTFKTPMNRVCVGVQSYGDDEACIDLWVYPLFDRTSFPDEAYFEMLKINGRTRIGQLNLQYDDTVLLEYVALFQGMTKAQLGDLIGILAYSGSQIGLELTALYGGKDDVSSPHQD